ncbi:MAG: hypothetical protein KTR19_09275 [Hyphomicrobiales bacterium]|nr:hypothetical protein [Hyphomicrobiales bacterium]
MATEHQVRADNPDERGADDHARRALGIVRLPSGGTEGLDPREMSRSLLEEIGHSQMPLLRVIRAKCLDCSHTASEVRRCSAVDYSLWPYRMGTNPFRAERSDAQKAAAAEAARRLHRAASKVPG